MSPGGGGPGDDRPDLELDLPEGEAPGVDLELDLPDRPPRAAAAPPLPPPPEGPWREPDHLARWALKAQDAEPWHPFVLLGDGALESVAQALALHGACRDHLRRLAEAGGRRAAVASLVLDDPAFARLRGLDEARWREEVEAWRFARPLWQEFLRDLQRVARDGRLTPDEEEDLQDWARRLGTTREGLDRWILARTDLDWASMRRVDPEPGGLHLKLIPGATITSAAQLVEVARTSPQRWADAAEAMQTLRVILRNVSGPEADTLRVAVEGGAARARAMVEALGWPPEGRLANALWLQRSLWLLDPPPALALPEPWDAARATDEASLLALVDGRVAPLEPALADGRLAAWLEERRAHPDQVRRLLSRELAPAVALRGLLLALGERRLALGSRRVAEAAGLVEALECGDPEVEADFEVALRHRLIEDWARATDQPAVADAAARAGGAPTPAQRRRVVCWALGSAALLPGVTDAEGVLALARAEPDRLDALIDDGTLSTWALATGRLRSPPTLSPGWSPARKRHEWLAALGRPVLVLLGEVFGRPEALVEALGRADERAERLLLHAEGLAEDGVVMAWMARHGRTRAPPPELARAQALRFLLWSAGLEPFHHPDTRWCADPAALADWGERRPGALIEVLGRGGGAAWVGLVFPDRLPPLLAALREDLDPEERAERALRALGRPPPTLERSVEALDFGLIVEGEACTRAFTLTNTSARGSALVAPGELHDPRVKVVWDDGQRLRPRRLGPGERSTFTVQVRVEAGRASEGELSLPIFVDGQRQVVPLRFASRFDLAGVVKTAAVGTTVGGALALGWRGLLAHLAGASFLATDGGYLTRLDLIASQPEGVALGRLAVVLLSILVIGPLATVTALRIRGARAARRST